MTIIEGEALAVLKTIPDETVDFCYIDPPFMSQTRRTGKNGSYLDSFDDMPTFLGFLKPRLAEARRTLKDTGTIMVHLDQRTSHYVKVVMDEIFGPNLINEIVWCYQSGGAGKRTLAKKHDNILFYAKTKSYKFNVVREPYPHDYGNKPGFHPDGRMLNDWWQIPFLSTSAGERCGYPTQKPVKLLERCLEVATDQGDLVLDFFCGSGTTAVAAKGIGRDFIVCDQNPEAIAHVRSRLS